jgi:uroporphyrinogen decarboxylase
MMTSRDRVNRALAFIKPDRIPRDFTAVPEIWERIGEYLGLKSREQILEYLDVDCRMVSYDSFCSLPSANPGQVDMETSPDRVSTGNMWRLKQEDNTLHDIWGSGYQVVRDGFGTSEVLCHCPFGNAKSVADLKTYNWPKPEWWNFSSLNDHGPYHLRYRVGSVFETAWSLYGFEKFLLDLALQPALPQYIMERITEVHIENLKTILDRAGDMIDMVYFYDDLASQESLLVSRQMYQSQIMPFHQRIIDAAKAYNKPVMLHCCGAAFPLIDLFIDMGVDVLNPIQPNARDMNPKKLQDRYAGRIAFHGGIDIQQVLPNGSPEQVLQKVSETINILGREGGYILAPAHNIQADTPVQNILAMYGRTSLKEEVLHEYSNC